MMVYWNPNIITLTFYDIKLFTLDYFVLQYFLHIVRLFPIIYFHIYIYIYIYLHTDT